MRPSTLLSALLVLAPAALVAQAAAPADSVEAHDRARMVAMKSDLRNLVTAQEAYFADHSAYGVAIEDLKFRASTGNVLRLTVTQNNAWAAEVRSADLPAWACTIFVNLPEKYQPKIGGRTITAQEGEPVCAKLESGE